MAMALDEVADKLDVLSVRASIAGGELSNK